MRLSIIILNYRTPDLTIDCLASLEGQVDPGSSVTVVDNGSGDGSAERIDAEIIRRRWHWAHVLRSMVNGGFAAGNNLGIRARRADAYMLLNSDTVLRPGAVAELRGALVRRPDVGIVGPRFLNGRGGVEGSTFRTVHPVSELVRAAGTGPIARVLSRFDVPLPAGEAPLECEWIAFACVLVRHEVIERAGLLDEGYFMYFEDVDYCRRVREDGWRILFWPGASVVHLLGGSSAITSAGAHARRAPRYYYEARARYFAKLHGRRGLWLANALWHTGHAVSVARAWAGHRPARHREREARDIWINALAPFRPSTARPRTGISEELFRARPRTR